MDLFPNIGPWLRAIVTISLPLTRRTVLTVKGGRGVEMRGTPLDDVG